MATETIYQLKIHLSNVTKPPIWRKVEVADSDTFYDLHNIIQGAMGWQNAHLHQFMIHNDYFGIPSPHDFEEMRDERKYKLKDIFLNVKQKITCEYDFGDGWLHIITLEGIKEAEKKVKYPHLLKGKSMCPPEDCGGPWGYEALRNTLNDPKHPEHENMREWLSMDDDEIFDPSYFDIEEQKLDMLAQYDVGKNNKGDEFMF